MDLLSIGYLVFSIQLSLNTHRTGLTPGRTSDRGNVKRSFLWLDGPLVGGESDGEGHCWTGDGGRQTDGSFYSFLDIPSK